MRRAALTIGLVAILALVVRQGSPARSQDAGLTPVAYLPIVEKWEPPTATPTATSTPSRTPSPTPIVRSIPNGNFELGDMVWVFENSAFTVLDAARAHGGVRYLQMGSAASDDHTITQMVTVPTDAPYLEYWHGTLSQQVGCLYDKGYVWVDPNPNDAQYSREIVDSVYEFCEEDEHLDYQRRSVDLRPYAGQTIELQFDMSTNVNYASYWFLDDIVFRSLP